MPFGKTKEPKAPKEKKPKPPKKPKPAKKPKPPKPPKKPKKPKKGQPPVENLEEGQELQEQPKKRPIILLLIPVLVIAAAAAIFLFVLRPRLAGPGQDDPPTVETEEPKPPELPTELKVGDESVPGMTLEANESEAKAVLAKTITYTYTDLNDAGAAAKTYTDQLCAAAPAFSIVDEEFVRTDAPDFTTPEGMVLLARNLPKPEPEAGASAAPEESTPPEGEGSSAPEESGTPASPAPEQTEPPVDDTPNYVLTVRITWSEGQCVVTADEEEGQVTSPPPKPGPGPSITIRGAQERLEAMNPAELGLPGESMAAYEIFARDGVEMVDGVACIRLDVYGGEIANQFMGSYLMSINGEHLYQIDPVTDIIRVLK